MVRCRDRAFDKLIRWDKLIHQVTENEVCTFTDKSAWIPILLRYEHWLCPKYPLLRKPLIYWPAQLIVGRIREQLRLLATTTKWQPSRRMRRQFPNKQLKRRQPHVTPWLMSESYSRGLKNPSLALPRLSRLLVKLYLRLMTLLSCRVRAWIMRPLTTLWPRTLRALKRKSI